MPRDGRAEEFFPSRNRSDRQFELEWRRALIYVARGAGAQRLKYVVLTRMHRKNDYPHIGIFLRDPAGGLHPTKTWHGEIHERQPGPMLGNEIDSLATVA